MSVIHLTVVAGILAVATAPAASCQPSPGSGASHPIYSDSSQIEYSAECDGNGHALHVRPDTPAAREQAGHACSVEDSAIANAPWPSGFHPTSLPTR